MGIFDKTLILSDLDGTLLDSTGKIGAKNADAIKYFMDNGGYFSFATGRNITGMKYFMSDIPSNAPGVVSNGAVAYDFPNDKLIKMFPIGEIGEEIAKTVTKCFPDVGIEILNMDGPYFINANEINENHIKYTKMPAHRVSPELIPKPWVHMLLARNETKMQELYDFLEERYSGKTVLQLSAPYYLEIQKLGVHKGSTAKFIADFLGVSEDNFYTAGDGLNDVQLVSCTKNGYAPENAHKDILKLTPNILPSNDEGAIAALIEIIESRVKK